MRGARGETATPRYEWKLLYDPPWWQAGDALRRSFTFTCHTQGCPSLAQRSFFLQGVTVSQNWSRCWEQLTVECWVPDRTSVTPSELGTHCKAECQSEDGTERYGRLPVGVTWLLQPWTPATEVTCTDCSHQHFIMESGGARNPTSPRGTTDKLIVTGGKELIS